MCTKYATRISSSISSEIDDTMMHAHAYYVSTTDDPLAARAPHRNNINVLLLLFSLTIAQSRPTAALGQRLRRRTPGWSASARGRTSPVRAAVPLHDAGGSTATGLLLPVQLAHRARTQSLPRRYGHYSS